MVKTKTVKPRAVEPRGKKVRINQSRTDSYFISQILLFEVVAVVVVCKSNSLFFKQFSHG